MEEISRACASVGVIMSVNNSLACDPIDKHGTEAQKREFLKPMASGKVLGCFGLTEPMSGSDAGTMATFAETAMIAGTRSAGVVLRADESLDQYYEVRIEPARRRVVFDRWPRPGDEPFTFERPLPEGGDGTYRLRILVDGSCVVAYVDDRVALSCRAYGGSDARSGCS